MAETQFDLSEIKITDYCWLQGTNPKEPNNWCSWIYIKNNKLYRSKQGREISDIYTAVGKLKYLSGVIGNNPTAKYDYWLKLQLPVGYSTTYKKIQNLIITLQNYSSSQIPDWQMYVVASQTDLFYAPVYNETGSECLPPTTDTKKLYSASELDKEINNKSEFSQRILNREAVGKYENEQWLLTFDLKPGQDIYYINIKSNNSNSTSGNTGSGTNLWICNTNSLTSQPRGYQVFYGGEINGENYSTSSKVSLTYNSSPGL